MTKSYLDATPKRCFRDERQLRQLTRALLAVFLLLSSSLAAAKERGNVWVWGNLSGSTVPLEISGLSGSVAVAGGNNHNLALKSDGTVWAWGQGSEGQLGNGTGGSSALPVPVVGLTEAVVIAAGELHSLALKRDGTVWAWGDNSYGQLGIASSNPFFNALSPMQVTGLTGVNSISARGNKNIAVKADGTVWVWGYKGTPNCGLDYNVAPVQLVGVTEAVAAVVAGTACPSEFAVLKADGTVWIGDYTYSYDVASYFAPNGLAEISAIAAGGWHFLALKADGTAWAWRDNLYGQLGDGTTTSTSGQPVQVSGLKHVAAIAAGNAHSIALTADGAVWAWGWNGWGQLGTGTTGLANPLPLRVHGLKAAAIAGGGFASSLAVDKH